MANANVPRGLVPYRRASGEMWNGQANIYYVPSSYATAIFVGDPVVPSGSSDANGIPGVTVATAGATNNVLGAMVGIVQGGDPVLAITRDLPIYRPASVAQYILVADDPDTLFWAQEDSNGGALSKDDAMSNVNLVAGAGSTATGYSGWQLQSSSVGTGSTLQIRLLRVLQQADNAVGVNAKWLVKINIHSLTSLTGV